jgi:hypothetical protein
MYVNRYMGFSGEQSCLRSITIYIAGENGQGEEQRTARMRVRVIFLQVTDTVYYHTYRRVKIGLAKAGTINTRRVAEITQLTVAADVRWCLIAG